MSNDPNVTITFTGDGQGAVNAAANVGNALDALSTKSIAARKGLLAVANVMDNVSKQSANVTRLGASYQSTASAIQSASVQAQASAKSYQAMAAAANQARTAADALNKTQSQSVKTSAGSKSGSGGGLDLRGLASGTMQMLGITLGAAAAGNEIRKLISANMDLDAAMSSVAAVGALEKTGEQYIELTGLAQRMGATTQYSAVEAAMGLKELVAAGYDAATAGSILSDTLSLAATENMDMGRASEILVASLQSFNLAASESTRVSDVMARAANASTASVDGMGEAMKFLGPVANAVGASLEEAAATVAILSNNGIQAGMAGRGVSAIMSRMIGPTKDAQDTLKGLGISLAELNPEVVGMGAAFKTLQRLENKDLVKLFGAENLDVVNVLKANASAFDDMVGKMNDVSITAKGMSQIKNDNLGGDIKKATAALQGLHTELGKDFYAAIRVHAQAFTKYLVENQDAIADTVRWLGRMAVFAAKVGAAYVAVKAVNYGATLIRETAAWVAKTAATQANTRAIIANNLAQQASGGGLGGMSTRGRRAVMNTPALSGRNVKASLVEIFVGGVDGIGPKFSKAVGRLGYVAAAAIAGWELGKAIDSQLKISENMLAGMNSASNIANESANALVSSSARILANARTEEEFAMAQKAIAFDLLSAKKRLAATPSGNEEEREHLGYAIKALEMRERSARRIYEQTLQQEAAERRAAQDQALALEAERERAKAMQEQAVALENMVAAAGEFKSALPDLKDALVGRQDASVRLRYYFEEGGEAVAAANKIKATLERQLDDAGVDTKGLIDPKKEIKNLDELAVYYATIIKAIESSGNENAFGVEAMAQLKAAYESLSAAETKALSAKKDIDKQSDERISKERDLLSIKQEIAINEAKAAGDTSKAEKLEREKSILEETLRINELLGGKKATEGQARALAERSVIAKDLASGKGMGNQSVEASDLGRAAQGINLLFGRSANAGLLEENKRQTDFLRQILAKEYTLKLPPIVPVFGT